VSCGPDDFWLKFQRDVSGVPEWYDTANCLPGNRVEVDCLEKQLEMRDRYIIVALVNAMHYGRSIERILKRITHMRISIS